MIIVAAWKTNKSGLGHFTRAKKYYRFLKLNNKKVFFLTFKDLSTLQKKIKDKSNTILIDTYTFTKKIEVFLRKKFNKVIIINDYQFKVPTDFYILDTFKFYRKIQQRQYLGQEYLPKLNVNNLNQKKIEKKNNLLIILNSKHQKIFFKIYKLISNRYKKNLIVNVRSKEIRNFLKLKKNFKIKPFISENSLLNYAKKSEFIISPGGQTMMNLIEHNNYLNVYKTSKDQHFYINSLKNKNFLRKLNFKKLSLKKNRVTRYIDLDKKNKLLQIF